ncbi:PREDICTED: uncharacterized protein LOC109228773 isoform X2 [Nicotiana attenuata]|uniref:uncharacterized protein LOC109228773 isoform X2 n=1 Tax=Nicotiana attenuata TaxID=49451 RepID=UPI000904E71F|nr:PREDICTED: uncharacterized protein LOC109228773 isoform X2 [Nicotiana attenuata]
MSFLGFALLIIDFLTWPVLALGYPLCASIRAIETGSEYHMRKLVTYWTIFSFISLFELAFEKLIEWIPLWPYIKLSTICWLVIPQFNGACYFYQNLIHPCLLVKLDGVITQLYGACYVYQRLLYSCLSVNLQIVTDWFNKPMEDLSLKNEIFLAVAERYLEENGSDALVKLIANKSKDYRLNHHAEEIKTTDASDEAGMLTPNQVKSVRENLIWIEKKTTGKQVKETAVPTTQSNQLKQEQAKHAPSAQSEHCTNEDLKEKVHLSDLNGRDYSVKLQKPLSSTAVAESYLEKNESDAPEKLIAEKSKDHSLNHHAEEIKTTDTSPKAGMLTPSQVKRVKENLIWIEKKITGIQVNETALPVQEKDGTNEKLKEKVQQGVTGQDEKPKQVMNTGGATHNSKLWCSFCNVRCSGEIDMAAHLKGRRHLANTHGGASFYYRY